MNGMRTSQRKRFPLPAASPDRKGAWAVKTGSEPGTSRSAQSKVEDWDAEIELKEAERRRRRQPPIPAFDYEADRPAVLPL
jgi:hypothetical protein